MTDKQKIEFRKMIAGYFQAFAGGPVEPAENLRRLYEIENWIQRLVENEVSKAVAPFVNLKKSD